VHWQLATLALILLGFAAISGRIEGTSLTAPMVFTAVGIVVGARALGLIDLEQRGEEIKLLTEATLTVVLFSDASRIDLRTLRGEAGVPARLLGIGLPLTLLAGFVVALALFDGLAWTEALLLAVILAPTDAALGQAVVTLERLPLRVRQSLNVESGLNDGICVPLFLIVLAVAQAEETDAGWPDALRLIIEQIGYGALAGVVAGSVAAAAVVLAGSRGFISAPWLQVVPLAGAALAFGIAQPIGGSGFIAAFVGGAFFGGLRRRQGGDVSYFIEEASALLAAVTFVVFGAVLLVPALEDVTWQIALYALLSLTIVRMIPVGMAMVGTGARRPTVAFLGWSGPRGLASIVFALLLVEEGGLPNDDVILIVTFVTVGISVFAHGGSAAPLARRYADWIEARPRSDRAPLEDEDGPEPPVGIGSRNASTG
jgi:NhaP-type Na+/H+ or K+/H+ antiporter